MKNQNFRTYTFLVLLGIFFLGCTNNQDNRAKYVFYFIGDGMGLAHISLTEAFLSDEKGEIGNKLLNFSKFPVIGLATTFSSSNLITESSAAGTALATGEKTTNSMLGVRPDSTQLTSIAHLIHRAGYAVGIVSNVTIDHATPAAFYANSVSRSDYYNIALQLPKTGFQFFGGGGFSRPTGRNNDQPSVYESLSAAGYTIARGAESYQLQKDQATKMFYTQAEGIEGDLPYSIDRKENALSLQMVTEAAIDFLFNHNEKGLFLMCEGGKIDWAAHSNDAKTTIWEILDFADAIQLAINFYHQHPKETLIVVTSDHETGGLSVGARNGYDLFFDALIEQSGSFEADREAAQTIQNGNREARIGWTSTSHTGVAVPVFAIGAGSKNFGGKMDNTDIPKKICVAMGIDQLFNN